MSATVVFGDGRCEGRGQMSDDARRQLSPMLCRVSPTSSDIHHRDVDVLPASSCMRDGRTSLSGHGALHILAVHALVRSSRLAFHRLA